VISAIILAAGESKRMGRPKMSLPWGETTVLGRVLATFKAAGVEDIVVVTGAMRRQVEALVSAPARAVYNPDYASGGMLGSLQIGLRSMGENTSAALIGLGDQPQLEAASIRRLLAAAEQRPEALIVPSFEMRRGHPWILARKLWPELLKMGPPDSPREFLASHAAEIYFVSVDSPGVIQDLDTPEDYRRARSKA
jgi:molybdenum cofactor cytidylyltransferase